MTTLNFATSVSLTQHRSQTRVLTCARRHVPRKCTKATLDYNTTALLTSSITLLCVPSRVTSVTQSTATSLRIALRTATRTYALLLSYSTVHGRLSLTTTRDSSLPKSQYSLARVVHSALAGTALVRMYTLPWDRVVYFEFSNALQAPVEYKIVLELLGSKANLALIDANGIVRACGKQSPRTAQRQLRTGIEYIPPPLPRGLHPCQSDLHDVVKQAVQQMGGTQKSLEKALVKYIAGVSPSVANMLCERARVKTESEFSFTEGSHLISDELLHQIQWWAHAHQNPENFVVEHSHGSPPYRVRECSEKVTHANMHNHAWQIANTIEEAYACREHASMVAQRARAISALIAERLHKVKQRAKAFEQKVAECDTIPQLRMNAQVLGAYAHNWQVGSGFVQGEWMEESTIGTAQSEKLHKFSVVTVPVPQDSTPHEHAQKLFKKISKLERALAIARARLTDAMQEIEWLETQAVSVSMARTVSDVNQVEQEIESAAQASAGEAAESKKQLKQPVQRAPKKRSRGAKPAAAPAASNSSKKKRATADTPGVVRIEKDNVEVIIGKSARGNESVTFDLARKNDIWLHVAGVAGAHVIARPAQGMSGPVSNDNVQFAADIAAFFSKSRDATAVPVSVTTAGNVRRARGSPRRLGSVVLGEKDLRTVSARPSRVEGEALAALESTTA